MPRRAKEPDYEPEDESETSESESSEDSDDSVVVEEPVKTRKRGRPPGKATAKPKATKESKKKKKTENVVNGDPFNVAGQKEQIVSWVIIGHSNAFVLTDSGQIGIAKFALQKDSEKPRFWFINLVEPDACSKLFKKGANRIYKEFQKKFNELSANNNKKLNQK